MGFRRDLGSLAESAAGKFRRFRSCCNRAAFISPKPNPAVFSKMAIPNNSLICDSSFIFISLIDNFEWGETSGNI
jgi:hypothetical protein